MHCLSNCDFNTCVSGTNQIQPGKLNTHPDFQTLTSPPLLAKSRPIHMETVQPTNMPARLTALVLVLLSLTAAAPARSASFYTQRPEDPKAVYVSPSGADDDTALIQQALNHVQETTGQGIVFLAPGRYRLNDTLYIWPGIRLIGYGADRPIIVLPANAPGFSDASHEKVMIFFAGDRPGFSRRRSRNAGSSTDPVPDANPGTFYSALANIDIEVENGNSGAVAVRARYAQHCFLAHMDLHLGSALAGIHEGGNVVEDVHFFGGTHAVWTSKPSPGWQFTFIDCSFEGQRQAAILEHEAGLTLIRPQFRQVPTAVEIEPEWVDQLWIKDARLEDISGPAFIFGAEKSPRNEINMEGVSCRNVPVFAALRDSGRHFAAPADIYAVKTFSHGLHYADIGDSPEIVTLFHPSPLATMPPAVPTDLAPLPACNTWVNLRDLGAKGDGTTDDTEAFQKAIADHRAIYLPSGFYIVRDTLTLKSDTVLIGLHPGATQIILPDGTPAYQGIGAPKALLEAPKGGSNIVVGIGLYTSGNNRRAVAALWKAGANSMMNDVRFLGGHGTPLPDGSRENPYNNTHTADPNPNRHWDSQYPSLWVTDGGGGTFLDLWTPSTFAQAGMLVSETTTEGRVYQLSSEHHARNEIRVRNAAHWRFYALQTEEERGESGFALPIEVDSSHDITFANFHAYRVISSFQPFLYAAKISNSRDIRFRNLHCDSNSKVSFDASIDDSHGLEIRQHEFSWLDISGQALKPKPAAPSPVVARGAKVEKLASGFYNISGGAVGPQGDFYFVDAHWQRIYRWTTASRQLTTVSDFPQDPVNLVVDQSGNLLVIPYADTGLVYALSPNNHIEALKPEAITNRIGKNLYLPVSDWELNRNSLSHPAAHFISPDGTIVLAAGEDFLRGATSWGVKSSPPIRSFGLGHAVPGETFYITDESNLRTWAADVNPDGSLKNFRLFAEQGGEGVTSDSHGNVYIAAGQIYVYNSSGKLIDTIQVRERPVQLLFGGPDHHTLFIAARTSLYSVQMKYPGR
ncbi:MAG: SMP-30/Gluconolaconase/LRE domain protein [Pedosphaera sp.]|nr:SMP-30/Gluconolaconase/LRE domain protein [Pedosphaera sp.]